MLKKPCRYPEEVLLVVHKEINFIINRDSHSSKISIRFDNRKAEEYQSVVAINNGRWKQDEHEKFIEALFIFGNEWKKVQKYIMTRTATQARSHAQKFFIYYRKKYISTYSEEELVNINGDHIISVLMELPYCELIAKICWFAEFLEGKKNFHSNLSEIGQLRIIVCNKFKVSNLEVDNFIIEKKKKFIKIIHSLLQNNSKNAQENSTVQSKPKSKENNENINIINIKQSNAEKENAFSINLGGEEESSLIFSNQFNSNNDIETFFNTNSNY